MPATKDIYGRRFGRLVAIEKTAEKTRGSYKWLCRCDCGNYAKAQIAKLINGHTKSCGCLVKEGLRTTHGKTGTRLYRIWQGMKNRCYIQKSLTIGFMEGRGKQYVMNGLMTFKHFMIGQWLMDIKTI